MARINGRATARSQQWLHLAGCVESVAPPAEVVHKKLWIEQVIPALTVTLEWVIPALTVTLSRINGDAPNKEPISPCNKYPCSWSFAFWGQVCDLPTNRLALATNSHLTKDKETKCQ